MMNASRLLQMRGIRHEGVVFHCECLFNEADAVGLDRLNGKKWRLKYK